MKTIDCLTGLADCCSLLRLAAQRYAACLIRSAMGSEVRVRRQLLPVICNSNKKELSVSFVGLDRACVAVESVGELACSCFEGASASRAMDALAVSGSPGLYPINISVRMFDMALAEL